MLSCASQHWTIRERTTTFDYDDPRLATILASADGAHLVTKLANTSLFHRVRCRLALACAA